jgi:TRAP-type C4-dicarboxylate transport system permease small subunit
MGVYNPPEIVNRAISEAVPPDPGQGLAFYIATLWKTVVTVGGIAFIIYLVWGGIEYLTSGGDKARIDDASKKISSSVIGIAILVGSYAVTLFIQAVFKINILAPVFPNNLTN